MSNYDAVAALYAAAGLASPFRQVQTLQPAAFGKGPTYTTTVPTQAPSAPPPPPGPSGGVAPPIGGWEQDEGYQQALAWAANQRNQANAQYANELAGLRSSTGLYDAQGNPLDQTKIEQLNPFSQAGLLRRAWRQAQTGGLNSAAAAGQLYSGAAQNAVGVSGWDPRSQLYEDQRGGYNSFNYHGNLDSVKGQYNRGVSELDRWRLGVFGDIDERVMDESGEARDRFIESRPAPPRNPEVGSTGPAVGNKGFLFDPIHVPRESTKQMDVGNIQAAPRPPKPPARKGYRVVWRNGRWVQVPRTIND